MRLEEYRYRCATCEEEHVGLPELSFRLPEICAEVSEYDRQERVDSGSDLCVLDGEHHFVRAVLPIPLVGDHGEPLDADYCWGVWSSLSRSNFERYQELMGEDPPDSEGPYFGWLSNELPGYEFPDHLRMHVHLQDDGQRPRLELERTEHPLAVHQRDGMRLSELLEHLGPHLHR